MKYVQCNSAEKKYSNLAVVLQILSQLIGLLFLCNSSAIIDRLRHRPREASPKKGIARERHRQAEISMVLPPDAHR